MSDFSFNDFNDVADLQGVFQRQQQIRDLGKVNETLEKQTKVLEETQRIAQQQALYQRLQLKAQEEETTRVRNKEKLTSFARTQVAELDLILQKCQLELSANSSVSRLMLDACLLQVAVNRLEKVKQHLPDMQDLQAYNRLIVDVAKHLKSLVVDFGLPSNPLISFKDFIGRISSKMDQIFIQLTKAIEYGEALQFEKPAESVTAENINAWSSGLNDHERACMNSLEFLQRELGSICCDGKIEATALIAKSDLSLALYAQSETDVEKLAGLLMYLEITVDLNRLMTTSLAAVRKGALYSHFVNTLDRARENLEYHTGRIKHHQLELKEISQLADVFKTESAAKRFRDVTIDGRYGGVQYDKCLELLEKRRKPIMEVELAGEQAKVKLNECMKSLRGFNIKSFIDKSNDKLLDTIESVEVDIKKIKKPRRIPEDLAKTELGLSLPKIQKEIASSIESEIKVFELQYQRRKRAAVTSAVVILSVGIVAIGIVMFLLTLF